MHISQLIQPDRPSFSFEFFPPKTEASSEQLFQAISELSSCSPDFVSVTYGAGGGTRQLTHDLVVRIKNNTNFPPIPHLTCVGHTRDEIQAILLRYAEAGVDNILALRGDPPRGVVNYDHNQDDFAYALDLVREVKAFSNHSHPEGFGIGVAGFPEGHPATPNRLKEMEHLKAKIDAGADYICTQLFFDNQEFHNYREHCELLGINIPIIAGIMPISTVKGMQRMAELSGGTKFPARLLKQLYKHQDSPSDVEKIGIDYATEQCLDLVQNNVSGIHYYTLNKSAATLAIHRNVLEAMA